MSDFHLPETDPNRIIKHGDKVGVAWRLKDPLTNNNIEQSDLPFETVVIDNKDSWHYSLIGKKNNFGRKLPLDENKKITNSDKNVKYHLVYYINYITDPDPPQ